MTLVFALLARIPGTEFDSSKSYAQHQAANVAARPEPLGYRHYADDVVNRFVERAKDNGVDVFRVFDAMNDPRNLETALKAVKRVGGHAQGTISYTTSPVHTVENWIDLAKRIEDMGADSIAIKDMSGILTPSEAFDLVSRLKSQTGLEVQLHRSCNGRIV